MHPIGTKVIHLITGDYGFVVEQPLCYKSVNIFKDTWVLWLGRLYLPSVFKENLLTGEDTFGRVLWEDPKKLYPVELEIEGD